MAILDFLKRKPISIEHPVFGLLTLAKGKNGPYWMHDAYAGDELAISIETVGDAPPTEQQTAFFRTIVSDPTATFQRAAGLLTPRYEQFFNRPLPEDWNAAFKLGGVGVPLGGVESNPWDVAFECLTNNSGFLFTCYFVDGRPGHVSVDT
ncbi:MAG TPA: hypothetical protein VGD41_18490 [Pyrinomonadaceae bacterium]